MKEKVIRIIIFSWTILSLLVDLFATLTGREQHVGLALLSSLLVFELLMCRVAYQMLLGKRWALITLLVYYGLRSLNIYSKVFRFYTQSGLNLELKIGKFIGVNLGTLIVFILVLIVLEWSEIL